MNALNETSYTKLRANLASTLDRVFEQQEIVIVRRKGSKDVALVPAAELASLLETAHLLRSPRNAKRLLSAVRSLDEPKRQKSMSVDQLRKEILGETQK